MKTVISQERPIVMMARRLLERVLPSETIDELFLRVANRQTKRDRLLSTVFDLMSQVVCDARKTIHTANQAGVDEVGVSVTSIPYICKNF